ncbi:hypothetical protein TKK_0016527 [Trichogramma kaykai]
MRLTKKQRFSVMHESLIRCENNVLDAYRDFRRRNPRVLQVPSRASYDRIFSTNIKNRSPGKAENVSKKRQLDLQECWRMNPTVIRNKFAPLEEVQQENSDTVTSEEAPIQQKTFRPPPIFVREILNINPLIATLDATIPNGYALKVLSDNQVKIVTNNTENYHSVFNLLKDVNAQFHTYQPKSEKGYKVVLRSMHPSADISYIKKEIESHGHTVINISNIKHAITKTPLPLFIVEIKTNPNNKDIFNINKLLNTIVSFEPPRKKRDIPQCKNCQDFEHTKKYCHRHPVYVKCAKSHLTTDCPLKGKIKEVICANCKGNHPASYKGCQVRKQLQQKLFPALRERYHVNTHTSPIHIQPRNLVNYNISYAQATTGSIDQNKEHKQTSYDITVDVENTNSSNNNSITKLENMMAQLMSTMNTMLNLLTQLITKL